MRRPRRIAITGASSGIGAALALAYARPGASLALSGRDGARLEAVVARCRESGAAAEAAVLDVADRAAMEAWIARSDAAGALDLAIANAGVDGAAFAPEARLRGVFRINVDGVVNTVEPALAAMLARGRGQIAIMASSPASSACRERRPTAPARRRCGRWARPCAPGTRQKASRFP